MAKRKDKQITCTVELTEGAVDRITSAFVDLYYSIKNGIHSGPLLDDEEQKQEPA